jgi:hypothetical protein
VIRDLASHGILVDDLGTTVRADEDDLQIGLKDARRDMVQRAADWAGNVSSIVAHSSAPSCARTSVRVVEVELELEKLPGFWGTNDGQGAIVLHGDRSATRRADKLDLTTRIDLSNPHDMRGPAAGAGDFISVARHKIDRKPGYRHSFLQSVLRREALHSVSPFYFGASVIDAARLLDIAWGQDPARARSQWRADDERSVDDVPVASVFGLFAVAEPARRLGVSALGTARWAAL